MRLRYKSTLPIILITAVFAIWGARASYLAQREVIRTSEEQSLDRVATIVRHATDTEARRVTAFADAFAVQAPVREAMRAQDREGLKARMDATWERLHDSYGIEGMQFSIPPGKTLLRMHHPEKFGDDVTGRPMLMLALTKGEAQAGVEVATSGAKIRGVVQAKDAEGVLGVVEMQTGYTPVLESVKAVTGYELAAYLKQTGEPPPDARMVDGYRELVTTNREAVTAVLDGLSLDGVKDVLRTRQAVGGERFGVVRVPLTDFGGNNIGLIVATRSFGDSQSQENAALRRAVVAAVAQIVAVTGAVFLCFNGLLVRPLTRLADRLRGGEGPDPALSDRDDEIGDLSRCIEKYAPEKA